MPHPCLEPVSPVWTRLAGAALPIAAAGLTALMAAVMVSARGPTIVDYQVILSLGAFGVWCIVLALRRR